MTGPASKKSFKDASGFGLTETLVSLTAGVALISASAVALNSTSSLIRNQSNKADLRQNASNGVKLLRSEVERSLNIIINSDVTPPGLEHTDFNHSDYQPTLTSCNKVAQDQNTPFKPIFGLKMADLNQPVIYGISINSNSDGYSLKRCGAPLMVDGRYRETEDMNISAIINQIGVIPCWEKIGKTFCDDDKRQQLTPKKSDGSAVKTLSEVINQMNLQFNEDKTPIRTYMEPALRIMTDGSRKLVRFIDPNNNDADGETSYLVKEEKIGNSTHQALYFAGYARADKRLNGQGESSGVLNGAYFRNVSSKKMNFLVDGSGSMSACILWGSGYGNWRIYWGGTYYFWSRKSCSLTRMESLQHELIALISDLPDDTQITLQSFSSEGYVNHRGWDESEKGPVTLGDQGIRDSAIAFVNTLDDEERSYRWGGTQPWKGLNHAFNLDQTDTLYFLSDGEPSINRHGGRWNNSDEDDTINYYAKLNSNRATSLKVNTISLGLQSTWMESLSTKTSGNYLQIDKDYISAQNN
jgi:hypothetical protein